MKNVIINFLTFQVMSVHPAVFIGLAVIWLLLLFASIASLRATAGSRFSKVAWFVLILLVPIVGLALYCFRCLLCANWTFLKPIFSKPKSTFGT